MQFSVSTIRRACPLASLLYAFHVIGCRYYSHQRQIIATLIDGHPPESGGAKDVIYSVDYYTPTRRRVQKDHEAKYTGDARIRPYAPFGHGGGDLQATSGAAGVLLALCTRTAPKARQRGNSSAITHCVGPGATVRRGGG